MKLIFLFKMCKILSSLQKCNKNLRKWFRFLRQWCLNMLLEILSIMTRINVIGSQHVTKQSGDFRSDGQRCFLAQFVCGEYKIRIKVLPWRLRQCLGRVNTLTLEGCSEKGEFGHSGNQISWTQ